MIMTPMRPLPPWRRLSPGRLAGHAQAPPHQHHDRRFDGALPAAEPQGAIDAALGQPHAAAVGNRLGEL